MSYCAALLAFRRCLQVCAANQSGLDVMARCPGPSSDCVEKCGRDDVAPQLRLQQSFLRALRRARRRCLREDNSADLTPALAAMQEHCNRLA